MSRLPYLVSQRCELNLLATASDVRLRLTLTLLRAQCSHALPMLSKVVQHTGARLTLYGVGLQPPHACGKSCALPRRRRLQPSTLLHRLRQKISIVRSTVFSPETASKPPPKREVLLDMSHSADLAGKIDTDSHKLWKPFTDTANLHMQTTCAAAP